MTHDLLQQVYSVSNDIQELFLRAEAEKQELGETTIETNTAIAELSTHGEAVTTELAKWYLYTEAKLAGLEAEYRPIRLAISINLAELETRLELIKGWIKRVLPPSKEAIVANETIYCYYRTSKQLEIENIERIPEEYTRTDVVPLKDAIKVALDGGIEVRGARLIENWNCQIKHGGENAIKNAKKLRKERENDNN